MERAPTPPPTLFDRAFALLRSGKRAEAEAMLTDAIESARKNHGPASRELGAAEFDLARLLVAVGDAERGIAAVRRALDVPSTGDAAERDRLTYLLNLGDILGRTGRLEEAEAIHRQGLERREAIFGKDTDGYAFGQEPLAEVLFAKGALEPAEDLAQQALDTLFRTRNARALALVALRGAIRAMRHGDEYPLLEAYGAFPTDLKSHLVSFCLERAQRDPLDAALLLLVELRERLEDDEASPMQRLPEVVAALSNVAREAARHDLRRECLEWLREYFDAAKDAQQGVAARMAIAIAADEAGDREAATLAYRDAVAKAETLGDVLLRSQVLRNEGVFHSQRGDKERAASSLAEALALAEQASHVDLLGRALVALGIFEQHQGSKEKAKELLDRALATLPAGHPDTLYARSHLQALAQGGPCGCGDMGKAIAEALAAMIVPQLPPGLLAGIVVESVEDLRLQVQLARPPTEAERPLLDRVIGQAVNELRTRIRTGKGIGPVGPAS